MMLAFRMLSALSTLDDELDRLRLEVWFALILAFARFKELSRTEEELERLKLEV